MNNEDNIVLFDSVKNIKIDGEFKGSIISKCVDPFNSIIFSDNIKIGGQINILEGLIVGFEREGIPKAFSKKSDFVWNNSKDSPLEYSVLIPNDIMQLYDKGQFSDAFPYTINMLHTAGLYLNDDQYKIDHMEFFKGEILKNPVSLISKGICVADRVVIDHRGDPVFYDTIIISRDKNDDLNVSFEPLNNVKMDDDIIKYIIILGIEELKAIL